MRRAAGHRVLVHVGAPKTGTSFVQDVLFHNREALAEEGVLYPAERFDSHFLAALDLLQLTWGGIEKQAVGAWDQLAEQVRAWPGTVIVSHEILATASRAQVARALESFGDAEVHVVYSARDLVRQIPAEWQENVKHRRLLSYSGFLDRIRDRDRSTQIGSWFWGVQEVPHVLDRWASTLPPERVHLVTVPPPGAPRDLLWERFAFVLGIDPTRYLPETTRVNVSLGVPETALVRRVNKRVNDLVSTHHYRELVRELLVHRTLSERVTSARLSMPDEIYTWAAKLSETWITELEGRGYDVVGNLEELRPQAHTPFVDPDEPDELAVNDAALDAIAALVKEAARLRDREDELVAESAQLRQELEASYLRKSYRARQKAVQSAESSKTANAALRAYRRMRGSSSRPA